MLTGWLDDDEGPRAEFTVWDWSALHDNGTMGDWQATGVLRLVDGQIAITELTLKPHPLVFTGDQREPVRARQPSEWPTTGITSKVLRGIRVGDILSRARAQREQGGKISPVWAAALRETKAVALKRGAGGYPDAHYRRIALAYLALRDTGMTNGITSALAKQEDRPEATIRDWLRTAEQKELLTPARRGHGGTRGPGPTLTR